MNVMSRYIDIKHSYTSKAGTSRRKGVKYLVYYVKQFVRGGQPNPWIR